MPPIPLPALLIALGILSVAWLMIVLSGRAGVGRTLGKPVRGTVIAAGPTLGAGNQRSKP